MEISAYKEMCEKTRLDDVTKKRILNHMLETIEAEVSGASQDNAGRGNVRVFSKRRLALLVAVIALMSSITVMAADYIYDRLHYQQKTQVNEDGNIVFADNAAELSDVDDILDVELPDAPPVAMKEVTGDSLEEVINELQVSPYLPISGGTWELGEYGVEVQENMEVREGGTSEWFYVDAEYRNTEKSQQFVEIVISISHNEMPATTVDSSTSTVVSPIDGEVNYRTYVDAEGREYVLYDMQGAESGEMETVVCFVYSEHYISNQITRDHVYDYYFCYMICQNMSDEEIHEFLDSLVTYGAGE